MLQKPSALSSPADGDPEPAEITGFQSVREQCKIAAMQFLNANHIYTGSQQITMDDHLHILITGDGGKVRNFIFSKTKLTRSFLCVSGLFLIFSITSYNASHSPGQNASLRKQVTSLQSTVSSLTEQLNRDNVDNETLSLQIQSLEKQNSLQEEAFEVERQTLINTAVSELNERSSMIERLMCNIGIDVKDAPPVDGSNSGGPFIKPLEILGKELLFRSDRYLNTINAVPLGRPIPGKVSSRFGHRTDPVNGKKGYHSGVDLRGHTGDDILATADGVVTKAFWNGGYGRYIEIDHGNGYTSKFAHMHKLLVKRGDKVTRGQKIGAVGNSGRSTGSHLHYEICLYNKPVDPSNFMQTKKLRQAAAIKELSATKTKIIKNLLVVENKK